MSTPPEHSHTAPTDAPSGSMVRVCDRCGTVCSADQEWCLNCGVRMTEAGQRLPGLRAAGLVVALAVLLAGGAAAASYAALRGDARSAANVPSETTPGPVAAAPAPAPAPVVPVAPAATTPTVPPASTTAAKPKKETPATPSTSGGETGSATPDSGSSGTGNTGGNTGTTPQTTTTTPTTTTTRTTEDESGPVVFASGQGTIYDPKGVAADKGEEGNAIDGSRSSSWKVVLAPGQTGGLGYVLDFDDATALKSLKVTSGTSGLKIKVLGTTKSALPPDELDSNWDTIASDRTLKSGSTTVPLKAVSGAKSKYRHVLVLFTTVPGSPATAIIREFVANR